MRRVSVAVCGALLLVGSASAQQAPSATTQRAIADMQRRMEEQQRQAALHEQQLRKQMMDAHQERMRIQQEEIAALQKAEDARQERERNDAIRTAQEERSIALLGAVLAIKERMDVFVSASICAAKNELQTAKDELANERQVGRESGFVDKVTMHEAGETIVVWKSKLAAMSKAARSWVKGKPISCSRPDVAVAANCATVGGEHCGALTTLVDRTSEYLLGERSLAADEQEARAGVPQERVTKAEAWKTEMVAAIDRQRPGGRPAP